MRRYASPLLFAFLLILAPLAKAQDAAAEKAIRTVIESQLQAFQRDDGPGAFAFAAPTIQRQFGNPENFMAMVRGGYPMVYRPREVEFRGLEPNGARLIQDVFFVGPDGQPVIARYIMERQGDGAWRIAGVYLVPADDRVS